MNVVIVVDGLDLSIGGGVGTFIYDLCFELSRRKDIRTYLVGVIRNSVEADPLRNHLANAGIGMISLEAVSRRDALKHFYKYIFDLRHILENISATDKTICNMHLKLGCLIGTYASIGLKNVYCVETYHNTYKNYHLQCWAMAPFIKKYICVSNAAKEEMHKRFWIPYKKLVSIPNGVSREMIRKKANNIYGYTNDCPTVISVGRLSYEKNLLLSAKAFMLLKSTNYKYIIIGDGPQKEELEKVIGSNTNIVYLGLKSREDVLIYLNCADIVLIPSLWEGRSILMLEAMALGKPLIISDCQGLREPFSEESLSPNEQFRITRFGYLVRTESLTGYTEAIKHFFLHPELHDKMEEVINSVSKENDMEKVADQYIKTFFDII